MLEAYRKHVAERAEQGIVPQPLTSEQTSGLVELLKTHLLAKKSSYWTSLPTAYRRVLMKPLMLKLVSYQRLLKVKPLHP